MALLFTILSGILGAVVNATAFGGASPRISMLRDHGAEEERKRHDLKKGRVGKGKG